VHARWRKAAHADGLARAFYIVTEKILMPEEQRPARWPVAGTTSPHDDERNDR
jgi:maltooligosyltrehalose synthase